MNIIKYFNDSYYQYLSGIYASIIIDSFIERSIKSINENKIIYYSLSNTPFINSRQLIFNKKIVGYFTINKTQEFTSDEETNYDLFINYLAILIYNTNALTIDISSNIFIEILDTTNLNILITDIDYNILYHNKNFINFIHAFNPYTQYILTDLEKKNGNNIKNKTLFDLFPQISTIIQKNVINKNFKINLSLNKDKKIILIEININSVQICDKIYNVITIDEKTNIKNIDNTSFLSHELRNPLQTIVLASTLLEKNELNTKNIGYIKMIAKASEDMRKIINDILDLNKLNNNQLNLTIETVYIKLFITELINIFRLHITNDYDIELNIDENITPIIFSDVTRLKQILLNFISNAIKYSKKNQKNLITIDIFDSDEYINFKITDNGIGIKQDQLDRIQEFNINMMISNNDSNGLGLFICNRIAKLLGGTIIIKSEYDKGSTFIFKHPIKLGNSYIIDETSSLCNNLNNVEKNILIVDDINVNVILLKTIIQNINDNYNSKFNIDIATSGDNCIILNKKKYYDIIFLDLHMNVLDGYCTAKILRENNFKGKIIVTTGDDKIKINLYTELFDDILIKPFDNLSLLSIIKKNI